MIAGCIVSAGFSTGLLQARQSATLAGCLTAPTRTDDSDHEIDSLEQTLLGGNSSACLWVQLGNARLVAARRGDLATPGPLQPLGTDYAHGAGRAFMHAIALNPALLPAARGLIDALALQERWPQEDDAARSLRLVSAAVDFEPPWLLLARARLERERGERDSVAVLLRRYLRQGGDVAVGEFELARELYHAGKSREAHEVYLDGALHAGSADGVMLYRNSLALVADSGELNTLDSAPVDAFGVLVKRFWARRDASAGRTSGERLAEHFRRVEVAERSFRRRSDRLDLLPLGMRGGYQAEGLAGITDSTFASLVADPDSSMLSAYPTALGRYTRAGLIWLRHGPPDDFAGNYWKYERDGQSLLLGAGGLRSGGLCDIAPRYCYMTRRKWDELRDMAHAALTTDDYPLRFEHTLAPVVNIYSLLTPSQEDGQALVVFGVRVSDLKPRQVADDSTVAAFPLNFRIIAYPPSGAARFELDTTRWFTAPMSVEDDAWITGTLTLPLPAGLYNARVVIEESPLRSPEADDSLPVDSRGAVVGRDSMIVSQIADSLAMSDIVPGLERGGLRWELGGETIALNPLSVWRRGEPIEIYYELAGLVPGSELRTQIRVMKGNDSTDAVTLSFSDDVRRSHQIFHRSLGTRRLSAGSYMVEVKVTTASGEAIVRRTRVEMGSGTAR